MKYIALFISTALATTSDLTASQSSAGNLQSSFATLNQYTQKIQDDINSFTEANVATFRADNRALIQQLGATSQQVNAIHGFLSDLTALGLASPISTLGKTVGSTVDALIAKKKTFVAGCHGKEIYQSILDQQSISSQITENLESHISSTYRDAAILAAQPISDALAKGVAAYADQANVNCGANGIPVQQSTGSSSTQSVTPPAKQTPKVDLQNIPDVAGVPSIDLPAQNSAPATTASTSEEDTVHVDSPAPAINAGINAKQAPNKAASDATTSVAPIVSSVPIPTSNSTTNGTATYSGSQPTATLQTGTASNMVANFGLVGLVAFVALAF